MMNYKVSPPDIKRYQYSSQNVSQNQEAAKTRIPVGVSTTNKPSKNSSNQPSNKPLEILVRLHEKDELQPKFIEHFSKYIINNIDSVFIQRYQEYSQIDYAEFQSYLQHINDKYKQSKLCIPQEMNRHSTKKMKGSKSFGSSKRQFASFDKLSFQFNFQAYRNKIILLLDLSSYMLIYDSSTKSFPLKNMEQIIKSLMDGIQWHHNERKQKNVETTYKLSVYGFSTSYDEIVEFLKDEQITFRDGESVTNIERIKDFINICISESRFPYIKGESRFKISHYIQKLVNFEEGSTGIQTIITISTFHDFDYDATIFFSSTWYTFAFVCTGLLNFATYTIQDKQIIERFPTNPYFKIKFVYKCQLLQNWQKIQLIEKPSRKFTRKYLTTATQKFRTILYLSNGILKQSIFDDVLRFRINVQPRNKKKLDNFRINDNYSTTALGNNDFMHTEKLDIPEENITEVLKTKYMQGWEQFSTQSYFENNKFQFRLHLSDRRALIYHAKRNGTMYNIKIEQVESIPRGIMRNDEKTTEKVDLLEAIKNIDLINTSNFDIIKTKDPKKERSYYNLDSRDHKGLKLLNFIFDSHEQWNRYFKVKKLHIKFRSNFNLDIFNQFIQQTGSLFGSRISNLCFLNRKQEKVRYFDGIQNKEKVLCKIIFIKICCALNFLEFKLGFLKFTHNEINSYITHLTAKLHQFKVDLIHQDLFRFCNKKFMIEASSLFKKEWHIGFPQRKILYDLYKSYVAGIIKRLRYDLMKSKAPYFFYYKILELCGPPNVRMKKPIFLCIKNDENLCKLTFTLTAFPSFLPLSKIMNTNFETLNEKASLNFLDCFEAAVDELKTAQKKACNIIKNYGGIYERLINNSEYKIENPKTRLSFRRGRSSGVTPAISIDDIPQPEQFLMESQITAIKGDLVVNSCKQPEKYYTFFNIQNVLIIYLWKKDKKVFYRCISIQYFAPSFLEQNQNLRACQFYNNFYDNQIEKEQLKKIVENIKTQQREQKFKLFYEAVRSGQNSQIMSSYEENLKDFYKPDLNFSEIVEIVRKKKYSHVSHRFEAVIAEFRKQFMQFIEIFFKTGQALSYFSEKNSQEISKQTAALNPKILDSFDNLILKLQYGQGSISQLQSFSQENFISLFMKPTEPGFINLKFYGFTMSFQKIDCLLGYIQDLIKQTVVLLNLVIVTQDSGFKAIEKYLKAQKEIPLNKFFIKIPEDLQNSLFDIARYIELLTLDSFLDFHPIVESEQLNKSRLSIASNKSQEKNAAFIANEEQICTIQGQKFNTPFKICLIYWIRLQVRRQDNQIKVEYLRFRHMNMTSKIRSQSYDQTIIEQLEHFMAEIFKYVKVHNIFRVIEDTLQFPSDTFIPLYINEAILRKLHQKEVQKKKNAMGLGNRNPKMAGKFKISKPQKQMNTKILLPQPDSFFLKLIYEQKISFHAKFSADEILRSLPSSQKLNSYWIRNLENTLIFENHHLKEFFFFFLQEHTVEVATPQKSDRCSQQSFGNKNTITISVYCINQCFKKSEKYLSHVTVIKKAIQEVTLEQIASAIGKGLSSYIIDYQEEEFFKGGQKWSLKITIPAITQKHNFRQYLKQHLQKQFSHIRAQFKSQIKGKECEKDGSVNKDKKSSFAESFTDLDMQSVHCGTKQCVPSMWIFNTLVVPEMHVKYGRCIYLLKISINSSHNTVENAEFWKRSIKNSHRNYIYPSWSSSINNIQQGEPHFEKNSEFYSLTNYLRKWGEASHQDSTENTEKDYLEYEQKQTILKFEVISYFGSPKFAKLQDIYRSYVFCALYDYWFETYLFASLNLISQVPYIEEESPVLKKAGSSPEKITFLSEPIGQSILKTVYKMLILSRESCFQNEQCLNSFSNFCKKQSLMPKNFFDRHYRKISSCHYSYNTLPVNKLMIEDKFLLLITVLESFSQIFSHPKIKLQLPFLVYAKTKNDVLIWEIFYKELEEQQNDDFIKANSLISHATEQSNDMTRCLSVSFGGLKNEKPRKQALDSVNFQIRQIEQYLRQTGTEAQRLGIMFFDSVRDLLDLKSEWKKKDLNIFSSFIDSDEDIEYKSLKYFGEGESFCQNEFLFRRSLYMSFECSNDCFSFFAYNFLQEYQELVRLKLLLNNLERWFFEKNRLFQFILSVKANQKLANGHYTFPSKYTPDPENQMTNKIHQVNFKKESAHATNTDNQEVFTKLLLDLAMKKMPSDMNFLYQEHKIESMYAILTKKEVNYKKYPQYKEKDKSITQRVFWEYLSILRAEYGAEPTQKSSSEIKKMKKASSKVEK